MNCPYCAKEILDGSFACKYCGRAILSTQAPLVSGSIPSVAARSVAVRAVVTARWTTNLAMEASGQQLQAFLASRRAQIVSQQSGPALETVADLGSRRFVTLKTSPDDYPMRASIRLSPMGTGITVDAVVEETRGCQRYGNSNLYVLFQNRYDGYFREWLSALMQVVSLAPGSQAILDPGRPLAQTPITICEGCGVEAPTQYVEFFQIIGAIILSFRKGIRGYLCKRCIEKYFQKYTVTTLLLGWWGVISFFFTLFTLLANFVQYRDTRKLDDVPPNANFIPPSASSSAGAPSHVGPTKKCLQCGETIALDATICRFCGRQFSEAERAGARQQAASAALEAKRKSSSRWGWAFSIAGGLIAGVALLIGLLFTIIQVSSPANAGNVNGFIAAMMLCPLPLLIVGGSLLLIGIYLLRKTRKLADGVPGAQLT